MRSFGCLAVLALSLACLAVSPAAAIDNGLGRLPQMGYNTWYDLMCTNAMNQTTVLQSANTLVRLGLAGLGYQYINLDDCWSAGRDASGVQYAQADTFPDGMQWLAANIHALGLKFGLYTDRGTQTCAGRPGAYGYEKLDAQTYANWGVDYLKEDSCNASQDHDIAFGEYATMRDSLNMTGRPIFFSLCGWYPWYGPKCAELGNSCRIGQDDTNWEGVLANIDTMAQYNLSQYGGSGSIMDPCMLLSSDYTGLRAMTELQTRTQFNQWAIMASPLLISGSLLTMTAETLATYSNAEVIAVNQDPLVLQGRLIQSFPPNTPLQNGSAQIWARQLAQEYTFAVHFLNAGNESVVVTCDAQCFLDIGRSFSEPIPSGMAVVVRDLWLHANIAIIDRADVTFATQLAPQGGSNMYTFTWLAVSEASLIDIRDARTSETIALE